MITLTKNTVEETYTIANGYEFDAVVIYGDTDSVMVKFGCKTAGKTTAEIVGPALALGKIAADFVSGKFELPIKLEFEKVVSASCICSDSRLCFLLIPSDVYAFVRANCVFFVCCGSFFL